MSKKNLKKVSLGHIPMLALWIGVWGLAILRLWVSWLGSLEESEAILISCAAHPAGGYVEGPCGMPLLYTLLLWLHSLFSDATLLHSIRWISPISSVLLSYCVWKIARRITARRPAVAFWSVVGVNFLPWVNLASLVADGALVTASILLLAIITGWNAVEPNKEESGRSPLLPWILFGIILALGTLFYYPIGFLLPIAMLLYLRLHGTQHFPWRGVLCAFGLLTLGWIIPISWNARHDWIQWSSVARSFDCYLVYGLNVSLSLWITLSALIVPPLVLLASSGIWWRRGMIFLLILAGASSVVVLIMPDKIILSGLPSPRGVKEVGELAHEIVALRTQRRDISGKEPILIASTPGLASLLGEKINTGYDELQGAPPVFVAESPSLNSSYSLWPSYADALVPAAKDILYTEEKTVSPFLGRKAFYITTEAANELPQTITGAFNAVGLLKEVPLLKNGKPVTVRIYQCDGYRALAL